MKLKIEGPDGAWTETTNETRYIDADEAGSYVIDTSSWYGEYEIWVVTDEDNARGVDTSSDRDTITMRKVEIVIEAETEEPSVGEKVMFTVRAPPHIDFNFETDHPEDVVMTNLEDNPLGLGPGEEDTMDNSDLYGQPEGGFVDTTDYEGLFKFVVYFIEDRTHTFKVWYGAATYDDAGTKERDKLEIDVQEIEVTLDVPASATIGETVTIKGAVSAGHDVDIYVEKVLVSDDETVTGGEFEYDWDTEKQTEGTKKIHVYVDCPWDDADEDILNERAGWETEDEKASIRLVAPGLTAEQPRNVIAEGDDYTIEGTATGVGEVDYILVGPEGWNSGFATPSILAGILIGATSVSDDEFSEDITMTEGLDLGAWVTLVLAPGRDGEYQTGEDAGDLSLYALGVTEGMNQTQILAIIEDVILSAGSDDLMEMLTFEVVSESNLRYW